MSTITRQFTKEQLIARINQVTAINNYRISRDPDADGLTMDNELFAIALASLEAEAVAWDYEWASYITCEGPQDFKRIIEHEAPPEWAIHEGQARNVIPLYTAPPAPVSVPDEIRLLQSEVTIWKDRWELLRELFREVADALGCDVKDNQAMLDKIEMLQGAEPVTMAYKLPANTPCKDALEHIWLQTAGVWPESGEFSELTWCSDSQHKDDTLYVRADVVSGNSPVIPDGWKLVPVELTGAMTNAMTDAILDDLHNVDVWRSVLAAEPQQEVK